MINDIERQNFWKTEIDNPLINKKNNEFCEKECNIKKQFKLHLDFKKNINEVKNETSIFNQTLLS
jgi:hypothetical protein